ncbi:FXYD domain-containing ion transport regulator 5 isoform X6 [Pongo pygmaeus]|uniref:FXYD domain-containing ion transport regulator 5 isoform X8 n=2 Tax=Pongo abelii TaxID=9601 RepID=UPI0023E7EF16|nr:FXYD domain-containing ion transport regulator 5 isoform X6 [Pongo abelii]
MTEPVWVPARSRSPGHTLRLDAAATAASLSPRGCRLRTPSSDMSPSGRLCLLTIVGLILPTRGQTLKDTTSSSSANSTIMDIQVPTPAPAHPTDDTTTLSERPSPSTDVQTDPQTLKPSGFHEDDPFFYDEHTLRKRGLLVAAVLFITGIIILTSGKCRQLSRLCRNHCR